MRIYYSVALLIRFPPHKLHGRRERARGGQSPPPPAPPGSGGKIATAWFPQLIPYGFWGGREVTPCKAAPSAYIPAGRRDC